MPTLRLESDLRISGRGPLNGFFGQIRLDDDGLLGWGPLGSTRRAGPIAEMELESSFFTALGLTERARLDGEDLVLASADATTALRFGPAAD